MSGFWELVAAVVLSLAINESSELSPWLAQKLIRWAAQVRYPTRVEELSALIAERPDKLFKLMTATGFACAALTYRVTPQNGPGPLGDDSTLDRTRLRTRSRAIADW
jgi:hypothetical protein